MISKVLDLDKIAQRRRREFSVLVLDLLQFPDLSNQHHHPL